MREGVRVLAQALMEAEVTNQVGECQENGVTGVGVIVVGGEVLPSNVMAKALRAGFQRFIQRLRPFPVGSRLLTAFDNAAMDTVWSTIKREVAWIRGDLVFDTREEAKMFLFEHIEIFYNRQRHQTALGHMTPVEYAATFTP